MSEFLFLIFQNAIFFAVGDRCITKVTGDEGICKISSDCPVVEEQAKRGVDLTTCGVYQLVTPIVCCPVDNFDTPRRQERPEPDPLIIFPDDEQPNGNTDLRISERKCEEYSSAITGIVQAIPLVTNTEPISLSVEKCDYNSVPLIVGGEPAEAGEFPFMAAVGFNSNEQKWRCGGTLISDRYVITAAHCTFSRDAGKPTVVRLGDLDLTTRSDGSEHKDYKITNIIVHPAYEYPKKYNDIALLRTETKIQFTRFIRPACLYTKNEIPDVLATATGWGRTDYAAENSDRLRKVTLDIYDNNLCSKTYQKEKDLPNGVSSNMLCAGEIKGGRDTCQGDSGGPLLITKEGNRCKFYIIGVTSFGKSCGQENTPAVYTKISRYVDWIERTIW
ncbi:hypothetical protein NQ317_014214 [Molorchus minor]|uniref:Peptidase S1 domain-containing protein n=1 Tax=Molorchus minor TaxID=1323400 RepID=A0ABQ9JEC4_9CUCU|nr:hypothetical protein NQ317_014214 [Molorchus minor]